jgi:nucleoside-diphosphate-sugar epimerase
VLAPDAREQPVQLIDARDLAGWLLDMAQNSAGGVYHVTGPAESLSLGGLLERVRASVNPGAEFAWVDQAGLAEAGVEPWSELPLWLDLPRHPELRGFLDVDVSHALAGGLTLRPLESTIADTLAWVRERGSEWARGSRPPAGISRERELELLRAWDDPGRG